MKSTILVLIFSSFIFRNGMAQLPVKEWDYRYGGMVYDNLTSITITDNGDGYLLAGDSHSPPSGDVTDPRIGGRDYWIVKIDTAGQKLWDNMYGGDRHEDLEAALQTSDGGFLLGGYSTSDASGDKSADNAGNDALNRDYWTIKTDASGNKLWDLTSNGNAKELLSDIVKSPNGGFLLAGSSSSGFGPDKSEPCQGNLDYWVVKIDENGNKKWNETVGGAGTDFLNSVITTSDGGYLLGGYSDSHAGGDKSEDEYGTSYDYWVVKISLTGNKEWDHRFGGVDNDYLKDMIETSDGGYLLGGHSYSPAGGDKTQPSQGGSDYWIVKLHHSGVKIWDARYGGSNAEGFSGLIEVSDGYILGGYSDSGISGDKTQPGKGLRDMWVVKTDFDGNKLWDISFGTESSESVEAMVLAPDNGLLLGGSTLSGINGDKTQDSQGKTDYWIVKTTPVVSLGKLAEDQFVSPFKVYPNPFSSSTTISFSLEENSQTIIELFDLAGRKIKTLLDENVSKGTHEMIFCRTCHGMSLPAGIYFLQVKINGGILTRKLVIQ